MKNVIALAVVVLLLVGAHPMAQTTPTALPVPPEEVKANFLKMINRPRVAFDVRNHETKVPYRNLIIEKLDIATEKRPDDSYERVPMEIVRPEGVTGRLPVVVVLHGTGGKKEGMWNWLEQLAHRGVMAVAIDGRFHGDRDGGYPTTAEYNDAIYRAFLARPDQPQDHPLYFDNCWDVMRTIDYLIGRDDVDANRIGLLGVSKGGIETYLTAAVDERVKVIVPAIAMQSFDWSLDHGRWQGRANSVKSAHDRVAADLKQPEINREVCAVLWAKVIPGMRQGYDGPSIVRLLAGRPTLFLNGDKDPNCPIEGAELAFAAARAAFHNVGADDRLKILVARDTGHTVTNEQRQAALDWFVTWLKPAVPPSTARYLFRKAHPELATPRDPLASAPAEGRRPEHPRPSRRPFGRRGVAWSAQPPPIEAGPAVATPVPTEGPAR